MKINKKILFIALFLVLFLVVKTTQAQTTLPLVVFPAIQDKVVKPNEKTRLQIQIKNGSNNTISGQIKVADYLIKDKEGTPQLVEGATIKPKYAASAWIKPAYDRISIPAKDFITVDLFVTVPQEVSSCGNYAIVYFQPDTSPLGTPAGEKESASSINVKIGGLVNFEVNQKECRESMIITNLNMPWFVEYGPINVNFDLKNQSDIHVSPRGYLMLTNMLGQSVDQKPIEDARIFPEAIREYKASLGSTWMFGRYKFLLNATYGSKSLPVSTVSYVWVVPIKAIIVIILTLIVMIILIKNLIDRFSKKEAILEGEIEKEKEEIEKLKEALRKKKE